MNASINPTQYQTALHHAHLSRCARRKLAAKNFIETKQKVIPRIRRDWIILGKTPEQWKDTTVGAIIYNRYPGPFLPSPKFMSKKIINEVCKKHDVTEIQIKGGQRNRYIAYARHEVCYRIHRELAWTLSQIGRLLGNRDHTTILSSIRRHKKKHIRNSSACSRAGTQAGRICIVSCRL